MEQYQFPHWWQQLLGRKRWREAPSLIVLSTGRTATTALARLLNLSPTLRAFHEPPPISTLTTRTVFQEVHAQPQKYRDLYIKLRSGVIGGFHRQGLIYAETNNLGFFAPVIAELLPNAKFVFVHRHAAEYVRSGMRRGWYVNHSWDKYRLEPAASDPLRSQWDRWEPFDKICWFWKAANGFFHDFVQTLPPDRSRTICFDDLIRPGSGEYRKFFDVLGVEAPSPDEAEALLNERVNEQQQGDFPTYPHWSDEQRQRLRSIAGPLMTTLGYE